MVLTVNGGHRDSHGSLDHCEVAFTYKHQHSSLIVPTKVIDILTHHMISALVPVVINTHRE